MVDLRVLRTLAEAANVPEPGCDPHDPEAYGWQRWHADKRAYTDAVSDPAVVLALVAVAEAARALVRMHDEDDRDTQSQRVRAQRKLQVWEYTRHALDALHGGTDER